MPALPSNVNDNRAPAEAPAAPEDWEWSGRTNTWVHPEKGTVGPVPRRLEIPDLMLLEAGDLSAKIGVLVTLARCALTDVDIQDHFQPACAAKELYRSFYDRVHNILYFAKAVLTGQMMSEDEATWTMDHMADGPIAPMNHDDVRIDEMQYRMRAVEVGDFETPAEIIFSMYLWTCVLMDTDLPQDASPVFVRALGWAKRKMQLCLLHYTESGGGIGESASESEDENDE